MDKFISRISHLLLEDQKGKKEIPNIKRLLQLSFIIKRNHLKKQTCDDNSSNSKALVNLKTYWNL